MKKQFSLEEAADIAQKIGLDFAKEKFTLSEFCAGLAVEMEHGKRDPETNVTDSDPLVTGKIAWAHLNEFPDYYTRLEKMENEADEYWGKKD